MKDTLHHYQTDIIHFDLPLTLGIPWAGQNASAICRFRLSQK